MRTEEVIVATQRMVERSTFIEGAQRHTDGVAGYVRDFLTLNGGLPNEYGRPWTVESCANLLKIPPPTLRRWLGGWEPPDQQEPAPVKTEEEGEPEEEDEEEPPEDRSVVTRRSNAKRALTDPDERAAVLAALSPEVRDELRADVITVDLPEGTTVCVHCPTHCPHH